MWSILEIRNINIHCWKHKNVYSTSVEDETLWCKYTNKWSSIQHEPSMIHFVRWQIFIYCKMGIVQKWTNVKVKYWSHAPKTGKKVDINKPACYKIVNWVCGSPWVSGVNMRKEKWVIINGKITVNTSPSGVKRMGAKTRPSKSQIVSRIEVIWNIKGENQALRPSREKARLVPKGMMRCLMMAGGCLCTSSELEGNEWKLEVSVPYECARDVVTCYRLAADKMSFYLKKWTEELKRKWEIACCICPLVEKMCPGDRAHLPEMSPNIK